MSASHIVVTAVGCGLLAAAAGCDPLDCGPGTHEVNGSCLPNDDKTPLVSCGPGMAIREGRCVPAAGWIANYCGPNTRYDEVRGACVGTGSSSTSACDDAQFRCPVPSGSAVCISGQVIEAQSFLAKTGQGTPVKLAAEGLQVEVYDPLAFVSNPQNTNPLATSTRVDDQGCFIVPVVNVPLMEFFAIGVKGSAGSDTYVLAGAGVPAKPGRNLELAVPAFLKTTIDAWHAELGGEPLLTAGAALIQYRTPAKGVEGVVPLQASKEPADWGPSGGEVYYLGASADSPPYFAKNATSTSALGAVLIRKAPVNTYGGRKAGCTIDAMLAGSAPGALLYVRLSATGSGC